MRLLFPRILFSLVLFLFISQASFAQLGVKAGLNYSTIRYDIADLVNINDPNEETEWKFGPYVGVFYQKAWSDKFTSSVEVLYTQKGLKSNIATQGGDNFQVHLHYFSIPLMVYFLPTEKIALGLGTEVTYLFDRTSNQPNQTSPQLLDALYDQDVDISLNTGAKIQLANRLWLEARFNLGLISVQEIEYTDINGQALGIVNAHNRTFQLGLGYEL
ncbi:MAG: porin family protein [Bacteroidota bacterium]